MFFFFFFIRLDRCQLLCLLFFSSCIVNSYSYSQHYRETSASCIPRWGYAKLGVHPGHGAILFLHCLSPTDTQKNKKCETCVTKYLSSEMLVILKILLPKLPSIKKTYLLCPDRGIACSSMQMG